MSISCYRYIYLRLVTFLCNHCNILCNNSCMNWIYVFQFCTYSSNSNHKCHKYEYLKSSIFETFNVNVEQKSKYSKMSINRHVFCQYCYVYFYLCWLLCWGYFVYSYYFSINTFYLQHDCGDSTMTAWPTAAQFRRSSVTSDVVGSKSSRSSGVSTLLLPSGKFIFDNFLLCYCYCRPPGPQFSYI